VIISVVPSLLLGSATPHSIAPTPPFTPPLGCREIISHDAAAPHGFYCYGVNNLQQIVIEEFYPSTARMPLHTLAAMG